MPDHTQFHRLQSWLASLFTFYPFPVLAGSESGCALLPAVDGGWWFPFGVQGDNRPISKMTSDVCSAGTIGKATNGFEGPGEPSLAAVRRANGSAAAWLPGS